MFPKVGALWGKAIAPWAEKTKRDQNTENGTLIDAGFFYWSSGASSGQGKCFFSYWSGSTWKDAGAVGDKLITAFAYEGRAVRCMVDTENL